MFSKSHQEYRLRHLSWEILSSHIYQAGASNELRRSIDGVEIDEDRGEIVILLSRNDRGSDRDIACAMRNIIDRLDLSLHWALDPCRYDDDTDRETIMIVGL